MVSNCGMHTKTINKHDVHDEHAWCTWCRSFVGAMLNLGFWICDAAIGHLIIFKYINNRCLILKKYCISIILIFIDIRLVIYLHDIFTKKKLKNLFIKYEYLVSHFCFASVQYESFRSRQLIRNFVQNCYCCLICTLIIEARQKC